MYGIYMHIPFCVSKCKYCDFASFPKSLDLQDEYIDVLIKEMQEYKGAKADTVYIGGGTPSVLSLGNIKKLLFAVTENFCLCADTEFTVEVNPATVDKEKAEELIKHGVNRISMGAQSFNEDELRLLGRIHSARDTQNTFDILRNAGFRNISLDLMYALPGQDLSALSNSVDAALSLKPEHISCYGLKFEEGTPLYKQLEQGVIAEMDEDTFADMYDYIRNRLFENGYEHYEISNFSLPGYESRHNLKYWQGKDYLGFGVAASSKVGARRYTHSSELSEYMTSNSFCEDYVMSKEEQMKEFIILGLRVINKGVDKKEFAEKFGVDPDGVFAEQIRRISPYVINTKDTLKLRKEAVLVSNAIMCEFI